MTSSLMRSSLALFVVAAVIFAPRWDGRGGTEPPQGVELAARMLAPNWGEVAVGRATPAVTPQPRGQYAKRVHSAAFAYLGAFMPATLGLAFLWLIVSTRVRPIVRLRHSSRLSRAPPLLQLA